MKVEILVHKITHGQNVERTLVDHFCLMNESEKRPTRTRIKKLLRRTFPHLFRWVSFVQKDDLGHYHVTQSGPRAQIPYHFWWYHFEIIPCTMKIDDSAITAISIPNTDAKIQVTNEILPRITRNASNAAGIASV